MNPPTQTHTALPPTRTPTPTQTPKPTPELATSAKQILGLWHGAGRDGMYQQFNDDGSCQAAFSRSILDANPNLRCTYRFEGTDLVLADFEVSRVPPCPPGPSVYQVQLLATNRIRFAVVEDACAPRVRTTAVEHVRVR